MKANEKEFYENILKGGKPGSKALTKLYDMMRPSVIKLVLDNKGNKEDAKDVLQDAVIAFHTNVRRGKFKNESSISTYVYSIARNIWLKRLQKKKNELNRNKEVFSDEEIFLPYKHSNFKEIETIFQKLGEQCRDILIKFYFEYYSIKEIAEMSKYANGQVVRNKKSKCMKQLQSYISELGEEYFKKLLYNE